MVHLKMLLAQAVDLVVAVHGELAAQVQVIHLLLHHHKGQAVE